MNIIIENIIDTLNKLSDEKFQTDVWRDHLYWDRVLNFGEAVNTLDDFNFYDDVVKRNFAIPAMSWPTVDAFVKELLEFEEDTDVDRMLQSSRWKMIRKRAEDVSRFFVASYR